MIKSMTGFGRDSIDENGYGFIIELKSVNHRYLDLNIRMPRSLNALEDRMRKKISQKIFRGKLDIFITQNKLFNQNEVASVNTLLADSYLKSLEEIKNRYNVRDDISVSLIARFPDVIVLEQQEVDLEVLWSSLSKAMDNAIDNLIDMRIKEGAKLQQDIITRCDNIIEALKNIEGKADLVVGNYRTKLTSRINELLQNVPIDQNRIATEIALYADKSSIDEEVVRLKSHLEQMKDNLKLNEPIGRKLDFIVQEMNREANTIASKADDIVIVNFTLNIKNEIEKIREQIQNIE